MPEYTQHPVQNSIASPIKPEEIRAARPSVAISPGPDGLTTRQFQPHPLVRESAQTPGNLQNDLHTQEISDFSAWRIQTYLHLLCLG